jgi:dolichol-phosphate mannosyltransferase
MSDPSVSIVIPTINEADNLPLIVPKIAQAIRGRSYEIIIVDDNSRDATPQVCAELARDYPLTLLVRTHTKDGLSGAVLHGLKQARGQTFLVMDADLQHPPDRIPAFLDVLDRGEAEFVLGSRYVPGGSTEGEWGLFRQLNSWVATVLARPFAGKVNDPMSGFFALRRETYQRAQRLTPLGYKIALELMCKCRVRSVREVPIHFGMRQKGASKLTLKQQFRYLEHLSRLYDFTFPRLSPVVKFIIAAGCGWFVGFGFYLMMLFYGFDLRQSVILAYPAAIAVTALFHLRYVRAQREFIIRPRPWLDFSIISLAEWIGCAAAAWWMIHRLNRVSAPEMFIFPFGIATLIRYVLRKEFLQDIRGLR